MCRSFKENVVLKLSLAMHFDAKTFSQNKKEVITRYSLKNMNCVYWYTLIDGILIASPPEWAELCDTYLEEEEAPYTEEELFKYLPGVLQRDPNEHIYFGYLNPNKWEITKKNAKGIVSRFEDLEEDKKREVVEFLKVRDNDDLLVDVEHDVCVVVYDEFEIKGVASMIYHARHILDAAICIKEGFEGRGFEESLVKVMYEKAKNENYLFEILNNEKEILQRKVLSEIGFEYLLKRNKYTR